MYAHSIFKLGCQSESLNAFFRRLPLLGFDQSSCKRKHNRNVSLVPVFFFKICQMRKMMIIFAKNGSYTSLDSSLELYTGSDFLLLLFVLFVSFLAGAGFLPLPLVPRRPTPLVSSSAANANKSEYCFCREKKRNEQNHPKWISIDLNLTSVSSKNTFVLSLLLEKACCSARCIASCTYSPVPVPLP